MRAATLLRSGLFGGASAALGIVALLGTAAKPPALAGAPRICTAARGAPASTGLVFGTVHFANSCAAAMQPDLQRAIAKLHDFEANARDFSAIADRDPGCVIAWWGAAMAARGNPLGGTLDDATRAEGRKLVDHARAVTSATPRERGLVAAMDVYYRPYKDQLTRARAYADAMDALHASYPDDADIAAFDGLAIIEGVDLGDKTFARQKRAGAILEAVMKAHPDHPGAPHYLIHAYDYTALAPMAVHAAEVYPTVATASSHAQHMPAHIWSMLGRWDRSIEANRRSAALLDPAADEVGADIVSEHLFDFLAYARLQKAQDRHVADDLAVLKTPPTVVVARYPLERGDWAGAAKIVVPTNDPFDEALARFTRAYGAARAGDVGQATRDLAALKKLRMQVADSAGEYWGVFVDIFAGTAEAWILEAQGKHEAALTLMRAAAAQDDGHEKHIYLENKLLAVRESLADMEAGQGDHRAALADYEASLKLAPNRYRSFLGAARAAAALGDKAAARDWWSRLLDLAREGDHARPGEAEAKAYLAANG